MSGTMPPSAALLSALETVEKRRTTLHEYEPTDPYRGCAVCHFGPGAIQHNTFLIEEKNRLEEKK